MAWETLLLWLISAAAGALLGWLFFRGLWITVQQLSVTRRPVVWLLASLVLRFGIVLLGFYVLARYGGLAALIAAILGFSVIRLWMVRRVKGQTLHRGSTP